MICGQVAFVRQGLTCVAAGSVPVGHPALIREVPNPPGGMMAFRAKRAFPAARHSLVMHCTQGAGLRAGALTVCE